MTGKNAIQTPSQPTALPETLDFLTGGGHMAELIRHYDWAQTPLGPINDWPQSLRTAVSICLHSRYPMFVWWGLELINLYNDAYIPVLGQRHPQALGQPASTVWAEIWDTLGPQAAAVLHEGRSTWNEELLLVMERNGYTEETYFTFSYSPVLDETGQVRAVFCACTEETPRVLGQRRLRTLRALAEQAALTQTVEAACVAAMTRLSENPHDVPFALLYLLEADQQRARLTAVTNLPRGKSFSPELIGIHNQQAAWPLYQVLETGQRVNVTDLVNRFETLPGGAWPETPHWATVLPVAKPGEHRPTGFLITGISPRLSYDDEYRGFFDLVAGQVATAIANARAIEEERRRAEALAELDRAKTAFFSNISHEFRTPLTLLLAPLEDALGPSAPPLPDTLRQSLELAQRNAQRLLKLVNTLLDFSRLEAGRVQAQYVPTDLARFTADLASTFRSTIERAGLRFIVDCPPLAETAYVDREMWEKIVLNLLSNAFKFTLTGEIEVRLRKGVGGGRRDSVGMRDEGGGMRDEGGGMKAGGGERKLEDESRRNEAEGSTDEQEKSVSRLIPSPSSFIPTESLIPSESLVLTVRDTGTGIPAEELPHLFTRFHRVKGAQGRSFEGSGIGLALVQELVELHHGTVTVESAPGVGSSFSVTIPLGKAHLPAERIGQPQGQPTALRLSATYVQEARQWLKEGAKPATPALPVMAEPVRPAKSFAPRQQARILLADDNADMRDYVRRLLSEYWQVISVSNGREALATALEQPPDLVLTDVMMPGLDGFGLLAALRADERLRTVPVILLSARAGEEAKVEGLAAGADDYLIKPFSARELLARVEAHLRLKELRDDAQTALRESEERFRQMADHAPVMIWVTDPDGTCSFLSQSWYDYTGQTPETGLGFGWLQATHPDDRARTEAIFLAANQAHQPFQLEYRLRRHDGEYLWMLDSAAPRLDAQGVFRGYIGSVIDISERKQVEAVREGLLLQEQAARSQAEQARADAEAANRSKDEFLSVISHELRSPLNSMLGYARLLRSQPHDAERVQQTIDIIERAALMQKQLIEDLLDTARVTSGKLRLDIQPVKLVSVIEQAIETLYPAAQAKDITLTAQLDPDAGQITGDPERLQQVVWNLLSNAVKYTPQGGRIQLQLERHDPHIQITVSDTGKGITPDFLPHVFNRFSQSDSSSARRYGGLGLGLALVKHLVELHGGTITASSPGEGLGSSFTVQLPVRAVYTPTNEHDDLPAVEAPSLELAQVRVLVVDDEEEARQLVQAVLERHGAQVSTAPSVAAAWELLTTPGNRLNLLISDIGMPDEDGYTLLRRLRQWEAARGRALPAIALTAYGRTEDRIRALLAGFQMHVPKPVEAAELVAVVQSLTVK